ncbi:MAG: hypothetical protein ACLPXB_03210 [Thiobacillaceae bacterium]
MSELFEMLKFISRRRSKAGRKGLPTPAKLAAPIRQGEPPKPSDYEAHHALVEALERFNGAAEPPTLGRIKALRLLEQEGLALQAKVVDQYLRNQETMKHAKHALWRECHMFWLQLAHAHVNLLKQVLKGSAENVFKPWLPVLALKSIRYTALGFRWDYHGGQMPTPFAWRRLNKLYRVAERLHMTDIELDEFGLVTTCAREYTLALMLELANPAGFKARDIELAAKILEGLASLPVPSVRLTNKHHAYAVDLSSGQGAFSLDHGWMPGKRLRYLDLREIHDQVEQAAFSLSSDEARYFCRQLASIIGRGGVRRRTLRTENSGRYWAAVGMDAICKILDPQGSGGPKPLLEPWVTGDISYDGIGFAVADGETVVPGQLVLISTEPEERSWQLMVVRWCHVENGKQKVGAQMLSRHPKGMNFELFDASVPSSGQLIFLPMLDTSSGVSNVLLPQAIFGRAQELKLHDGKVVYHLQLGNLVEAHEDWARSSFEVLARDTIEKVA